MAIMVIFKDRFTSVAARGAIMDRSGKFDSAKACHGGDVGIRLGKRQGLNLASSWCLFRQALLCTAKNLPGQLELIIPGLDSAQNIFWGRDESSLCVRKFHFICWLSRILPSRPAIPPRSTFQPKVLIVAKTPNQI
jgi:hypothetical protein